KSVQHFLANFSGTVLLAKGLAVTFPILRDHLSGPPFDGRIVSEARGDPHLHDVTRLGAKPGDIVRVVRCIERLTVQGMVDGQIACTDVDFAEDLSIDGHSQTVFALHLLIVALAVAVEPAAHVPVKVRMIAVVEYAEIASV